MDFGFGAGRELYDRREHPRLFFGSADVPTLRARMQTGLTGKIMAGLRARVADPVRTVLDTDDLANVLGNWNRTWHEPGTRIVFAIQDMAMVGVLDEDADCLEAVRRVLTTCSDAENAGRQEPVRAFSYSAIGVMAKAYDIVHSRLTADERRTFCTWAEHGVEATLEKLRPRFFLNAGGNMAVSTG